MKRKNCSTKKLGGYGNDEMLIMASPENKETRTGSIER